MKKIKDLTLEECRKICKESSCCDDCQIKNICYGFYNIRSIDLNQNIEMIDVPVEEPKTNEMSVQNILYKNLEVKNFSTYRAIEKGKLNMFAVFEISGLEHHDTIRVDLTQEEYDYLSKELLKNESQKN